MSEQIKSGTSDMPEPKVIDYDKFYKVSNVFISDLTTILNETAYVEAVQFFNVLKRYDNVLPVAELNAFIQALSRLPYKTVKPLMDVIENKELFSKYFILLPPSPTK